MVIRDYVLYENDLCVRFCSFWSSLLFLPSWYHVTLVNEKAREMKLNGRMD